MRITEYMNTSIMKMNAEIKVDDLENNFIFVELQRVDSKLNISQLVVLIEILQKYFKCHIWIRVNKIKTFVEG